MFPSGLTQAGRPSKIRGAASFRLHSSAAGKHLNDSLKADPAEVPVGVHHSDDPQRFALPAAMWLHVPAGLMSCTLHLVVFVTLGLLARVDQPRSMPTASPDREAGIVLVQSSAGGQVHYLSPDNEPEGAAASDQSADQIRAEASSATNDQQPATLDEILKALPSAAAMPTVDAPQLPSSTLESGNGDASPANAVADSLVPAANGLGRGNGDSGLGRGHGYDVETSVFGVTGRGSKFVYVFDRSASMSSFEGRPLSAAKRELLASIDKLGKVHQFQVIFYNHDPHLMSFESGHKPILLFASDDGKQLAHDFIARVIADGGTNHIAALRLALAMQPDVIFFLTDADEPRITQRELAQIRERNRGATISTVEYGAGPRKSSNSFLQDLAEQNGGQHKYIDVTQLPRR
jgi:hypothetical protein